MPPKPKFTRDEIVAAAFALVSERGSDALTARELGAQLGSSARPIFTVFEDMAEVRAAVRERAKECFFSYMAVAEDFDPAFKMRGIQYVTFAREQPELFRLLFMQGGSPSPDLDDAIRGSAFGSERDIAIIMRDYHATPEQAEHLFRQLWIYTYGLCVLCTTGALTLSDSELAAQLGEIFRGMVHVVTSEAPAFSSVQPVQHSSEQSARIRRESPDLGSGTTT